MSRLKMSTAELSNLVKIDYWKVGKYFVMNEFSMDNATARVSKVVSQISLLGM